MNGPQKGLVHYMVLFCQFLVVCCLLLDMSSSTAMSTWPCGGATLHSLQSISQAFKSSACFYSLVQSAGTSAHQGTACIDCHPAIYSLQRLVPSRVQPAVTAISKVRPAKTGTSRV